MMVLLFSVLLRQCRQHHQPLLMPVVIRLLQHLVLHQHRSHVTARWCIHSLIVTALVLITCGHTLTPPPVTALTPITCDGTMLYTFPTRRSADLDHVWTYTYTIDVPELVIPADDGTTVQCPAEAVPPTPPTVTDACGNTITPTPGTAPTPIPCDGTMVYTFTYSDCAGVDHVWTYTYSTTCDCTNTDHL